MRKLSAYLLAALLLAACTPEQPAGENTFYVSIPPLRSIVEGIVGDDFKIEVLVPQRGWWRGWMRQFSTVSGSPAS